MSQGQKLTIVQVRVKGWNGVKGIHPSGGDRKEFDGVPQSETFITGATYKLKPMPCTTLDLTSPSGKVYFILSFTIGLTESIAIDPGN